MTDAQRSSGHKRVSPTGLLERLVGFGFHLLYHRLAWIYDAVAWSVSLGQWQAWVRAALPHLAGENILEIGHGPGHLLTDLAERGFRPVGLDASPQMTRLAGRRLRRAGFALTLVQGYAQALPFPDGTFDTVVATFPTAFILDAAVLAETARVSGPQGRFVVVIGAHLSGRDPLSRLIKCLYHVAGQQTALDADARSAILAALGLAGRWFQVEMRRSKAWVLVAELSTPRDKDQRRSG